MAREHTPIDTQFSSVNLATNLEPAFSSASFSGLNRHTTLMLSSAGGSFGISATDEVRDIVDELIFGGVRLFAMA